MILRLVILNILFFSLLGAVVAIYMGDAQRNEAKDLHWSMRKDPPPYKRPLEVKWEEEPISLKAAAPVRPSNQDQQDPR